MNHAQLKVIDSDWHGTWAMIQSPRLGCTSSRREWCPVGREDFVRKNLGWTALVLVDSPVSLCRNNRSISVLLRSSWTWKVAGRKSLCQCPGFTFWMCPVFMAYCAQFVLWTDQLPQNQSNCHSCFSNSNVCWCLPVFIFLLYWINHGFVGRVLFNIRGD